MDRYSFYVLLYVLKNRMFLNCVLRCLNTFGYISQLGRLVSIIGEIIMWDMVFLKFVYIDQKYRIFLIMFKRGAVYFYFH